MSNICCTWMHEKSKLETNTFIFQTKINEIIDAKCFYLHLHLMKMLTSSRDFKFCW